MKNKAKDLIEQYVERFDYHINDYKSGNYNESQARTDFINPFFEALGWDINNKAGLAESYREVIYEDKIKVGGSTKAPDYCFTVYGQKKFFVEAKKPKVNIKEQLKARISYTDKKIDQLVYQLYDLTEEEIKIVEGE